MYQPGDVVLIPFPFSDLQTTKRRPVLVMHAADDYGDMPCLAITSSSRHEQSILLQDSSFRDGILPKISWVRYGKIYTLNDSMIIDRFGILKPEIFGQVLQHLCRHLGC